MTARALPLLLCASLAGCIASGRRDDYASSVDRARGATPAVRPDARTASRAATDATAPAAGADGGAVPESLSVEQALMLALQHNRSLRVEQHTTQLVGAYEAIERGVFDPEAFARIEYGRQAASETTDVTGEQFTVRSDSDAVVAGVRQRLPTGTELELAASRDRSASSRRPEQYEARLGLTVTQALLRGFGPAANLAEVRRAELETLASVWELRGFTEALLAQTEQTYWRYVLSAERIAIVTSSLEVARQQLHEVEQFIAVGKLAPFDAAPLQAEVARREQDLIDARSQQAAERLRLLRLTGLDDGGDPGGALHASSDPALAPGAPDDAGERIGLAKRLRGDLNQARMELEAGRLEVVRTQNGTLPKLDLFITLGKSGYADSFGGSVEDLGGDSYDFAVGLELSQALGGRSAGGRARVAQLSRRVAEDAIANLEGLVELDVRLSAIELSRSAQQIGASAATRALRERSVEAAVERLRVGTGTALDLAQAQRDLLESQLAEVEAMVAHRLALIEVYRAEGSLLERRGLRVPLTP